MLRLFALTFGFIGLALGCTSARQEIAPPSPCPTYLVRFSIANQDRLAPEALFDVWVDDESVMHGPVHQLKRGAYLYFSTRTIKSKVKVKVQSAADGETLVAQKEIPTTKQTWIVITRSRDMDGAPQVQIEFSYENLWE